MRPLIVRRGFRSGLIGILVLGSFVSSSLLAQYPTSPPAPAAITPAVFPPFQEAMLANGMRLVVVQSKKQPVVAVSLSLPAGSSFDPSGRSGTAELVAGLLTKGAGTRDAEQVAEAIESVGGSISAGVDADFLTVSATVLSNDTKLAFALVADAVARPRFAEKELELLRTQSLSGLQLEQSQPAAIADRAFRRGLYGAHPYGRKPDAASVKAITRDDLVAFQRARLRPAGALLIVSGDLSLADARALANSAFAGWSGAPAAAPRATEPVDRKATEIVLVHRPGSVQSNILVGNLTWTPTNPRVHAAAVMNRVLGDGASGRLFMTLREAKSWTYGAYSGFERRKGVGYFVANTEVRTEVTDSALVELLAQLKRVTTEPISAADIDAAKNAIAGAFPLGVETSAQVAAKVASTKLYGLGSDYLAKYRQRIAAVTPVAAQAAALAGIKPAQALIVVVGDGGKIYERLRTIAPVRIVAPDGSALKPEDLVVKGGSLDLARDLLVPRTDSFTILVQGNAFGWQRGTLARAEGGWLYTEDTQLATIVQQHTEVRTTEAFLPRSVMQRGQQQGKAMTIDVTYADGRAKGSATTPQGPRGEMKTTTVDAEMPAGAIDDNLLFAIAPGLKLGAGAKVQIPVFQSGKGAAVTMTLTVVGEEEVKVPAGTFAAWKVEMSGSEQPGTFWIEKSGAHRLLKLAIAGAPIEIVRAK